MAFPLGHFANAIFGSAENLLLALLWGSVGIALLSRRQEVDEPVLTQPAGPADLGGVGGWRKHPLIAFFVLAYLLTWWIYPLLRFSPLLGIPGLFGPALAAIIMAAVTGGKSGVKQLLSRVVLWRVGVRWYVIALGLPTVLSLAAAGLYYLFDGSRPIQIGAVSVLDFIVFVLVVGEELGWRGTRCRCCSRSGPP